MNEEVFIVEMCGILIEFFGVKVFDGVDFCFFFGEVYVFMGENGVGKLMLIKVLIGVYWIDFGFIVVLGSECCFGGVDDVQEVGVLMVYQEVNFVFNLLIGENVMFGYEW